MKHNHKRTTSSMATFSSQPVAPDMARRRGTPPPYDIGPDQYFMEARQVRDAVTNDGRKAIIRKPVNGSFANNNNNNNNNKGGASHSRAWSCTNHQENDRNLGQYGGHVYGTTAGYGRYGELPRPDHMYNQLPATIIRRGSQSSFGSSTSASTPPPDCISPWSASTTPDSVSPDSMSPASPPFRSILHPPPERTSSKVPFLVGDSKLLPVSESPTPGRTVRPVQSLSRSTSKRFHNTSIDSSVLEEDEHSEMRCSHVRHSSKRSSSSTILAPSHTARDDCAVSSLHQRRQQRQEKMSTYSPFPQAEKATLGPLPPLPLQRLARRTPSSKSGHRGLNREASRSLPQLRGYPSPPPSEPLPPLPPIPQISLMFPRPPSSPTTSPDSVHTLAASFPSPACSPPPPPPHTPVSAAQAPTTKRENGLPMSIEETGNTIPEVSRRLQQHQREESQRWEEQLRMHKEHLQHFTQLERPHERLKMSRTFKSLGNLRARSRAQSTPTACDDTFTAPSIVRTYTALPLRPKTSKSASSKPTWNAKARLDNPLPPLPAPDVSVFEDDSDEEGDPVRRFVRNLFSRRARSGEAGVHISGGAGNGIHDRRAASSASKDSTKTHDSINHNTRSGNRSVSSSFSVATTVASTVASSTTTIAASGSEADSSLDADCRPTAGTVHIRQRGPLITRMFVRRSR